MPHPAQIDLATKWGLRRRPAKLSCVPFEIDKQFHAATSRWFGETFGEPTLAQQKAWPEISDGNNTLLLAPTGSGKTLAAFLVAIDRIMFGKSVAARSTSQISDAKASSAKGSVKTLYISPLKALGVDVERNLRTPLAGIQVVAERDGFDFEVPKIAVRSGDTPSGERARLAKRPPDILITTPESLFLLLTSKAREILAEVETVIIDEIHSLVANKRGAHLFASLERLEHLRRRVAKVSPLQRIGLSATQRPLDEVARLLGGAEASANEDESPRTRNVAVVEAGRRRKLDLTIEVPVEDMTQLAEATQASGKPDAGPGIPSIWPSIHPRLVELIRQHRSTMIFVNSRRLAERLAASINELAEEEIALAHHGSIAKESRLLIEGRLKQGELPAIVATSSLELGIDMGAVDLVIQIEAPPSIASGLQRIGRAGHQVGAESKGIFFPKFRGDLLASSAAVARMLNGEVEETFYPRNPLDVLAQQIVAMVAEGPVPVDELYSVLRGAAPFHDLARSSFENVLDLLAGRYPSDEFSELQPRLNWDRLTGEVSPRRGTQRLAVLNAGTIPDRGLYGVFLADGDPRGGRRVGELDEEMVFETRVGDVFLLGASSWRVVDITKDQVLVIPAPGEPGRMPFWKGDGPGRPVEFGQAIGDLAERLVKMPPDDAQVELVEKHSLNDKAASNLMKYLHEQLQATEVVPSDRMIVVECFVDEIGDWRVAILSPFGARVHAPWAMAVMARINADAARDIDMMWSDDGIVFRLPETDSPPDVDVFFPDSSEVEDIVVRQLGSTALFASHFRENAARALLLPRRQPGKRTPLWLQRRRAADLLAVASRYSDFPILLETYRECLRDVFDIRGLKDLLRNVESRKVQVKRVVTEVASPFASSLLFNYVGNFLYDGDAPLAERRAAALSLDQAQLRELLGDAELRELIVPEVVDELAAELQRLDQRFPPLDEDGLHDLLLYLGDLSRNELHVRCDDDGHVDSWLETLMAQRRVIALEIAGDSRFAAAEDAARFRDGLGIGLPEGLPDAFLEEVVDPVADLVSRFARTNIPFKPEAVSQRLGLDNAIVRESLARLVTQGRIVVGEFLPGGRGREICDADVLKKLKRRSLAKLRQQIEPVEPHEFARFLVSWHGIDASRKGLDGLLDTVEQLQGLPLPASDLEQLILPARIDGYRSADLDELCAAGEVVWQGIDDLGSGDGRVALYLTDHLPTLGRQVTPLEHELADQIRELLTDRGAQFFSDIERATRQFRNDLLTTLWELVWNGEVTNDTLAPLRMLRRDHSTRRKTPRRETRRFRSRRNVQLPGSEGRWSLVDDISTTTPSEPSATERQTALASQLLERYGVVTREIAASESPVGGFSGLYPIFKLMEETGRARRGYFVSGQGAAQFALPGAEDRLRQRTDAGEESQMQILASTDPANPYGAAFRWPDKGGDVQSRPSRTPGTRVILHQGTLAGYLNKSGSHLLTFLPDEEPEHSVVASELARALAGFADRSAPVFLEKIDGRPGQTSAFAQILEDHGFAPSDQGMLLRRTR